MQIRRAVAADQAALAKIRRSAILSSAVPALAPEEAAQWAAAVTPARFARAIRDHAVWVAGETDLAGWVEVAHDRIAALYVEPKHAGRGVGGALLAHAEAAIRRAGYGVVRLEASRNALPFYLRRGYMQHGPPDSLGAYPMRKELLVSPS